MPLWVQLVCTAWICLLVPAYFRHYGPGNFLWFSDIALFMTGLALWTNSRLLVSMAAVSVFALEIGWNLDFFGRLLTGSRMFGLSNYMFDPRNPLAIRALSLFHVWLLPLWIWMFRKWGYDPHTWLAQTLLGWAVLLLTYGLTNPAHNINWVFGPLGQPQQRMPARVYLLLVMLVLPTVVYLPTHLIFRQMFPNSGVSPRLGR